MKRIGLRNGANCLHFNFFGSSRTPENKLEGLTVNGLAAIQGPSQGSGIRELTTYTPEHTTLHTYTSSPYIISLDRCSALFDLIYILCSRNITDCGVTTQSPKDFI